MRKTVREKRDVGESVIIVDDVAQVHVCLVAAAPRGMQLQAATFLSFTKFLKICSLFGMSCFAARHVCHLKDLRSCKSTVLLQILTLSFPHGGGERCGEGPARQHAIAQKVI